MSLRKASYNHGAAELLPPDAEFTIFELDGIPGFSEDNERSPPPLVVEVKKRIREAGAILFVTPEYNYSIPGVLKNAIDWASRSTVSVAASMERRPFLSTAGVMMGLSTSTLFWK